MFVMLFLALIFTISEVKMNVYLILNLLLFQYNVPNQFIVLIFNEN